MFVRLLFVLLVAMATMVRGMSVEETIKRLEIRIQQLERQVMELDEHRGRSLQFEDSYEFLMEKLGLLEDGLEAVGAKFNEFGNTMHNIRTNITASIDRSVDSVQGRFDSAVGGAEAKLYSMADTARNVIIGIAAGLVGMLILVFWCQYRANKQLMKTK